MQKRTLGVGGVLAGLIVLLVSAYADAIGLGKWNGVGPNQIAGIVLGAVVMLAGISVAVRSRASS